MISKPPELANKTPAEWIREFRTYMQDVRFQFMRVHGLWIPARAGGTAAVHGTHPAQQLVAGESAYVGLVLPRDTAAVREAAVHLIATGTGTIDWTATVTYGAIGTDEAASTATMTADGLAVTDDRLTAIIVTDLFADVVADEQVGLQFTLDAATTTTDVYVLGCYLKLR